MAENGRTIMAKHSKNSELISYLCAPSKKYEQVNDNNRGNHG